jgi:signal transduction histidine kinase
VDALHGLLWHQADEQTRPLLVTARQQAETVFRGAGATDAADALAASGYAADAVASLAADGRLTGEGARAIASALADARRESHAAVSLDLYQRAVASPVIRELPPLVGAEIVLRLLHDLGIVTHAGLWSSRDGALVEVVAVGEERPGRADRAAAWAALHRRRAVTRTGALHVGLVRRFGEPCASIVARVGSPRPVARAHIETAAHAVSALLEREQLLERSAAVESRLVSAGERRLSRLGFDLHDGPIQDVLALGADVQQLRSQVTPLVGDERRALVDGRFDDLLARVTELDRALRDLAHSLESRSILARPLSEVLHREVDAFSGQSGIEARLEIKGDPGSLTHSQRITVFRGIQESLANVREHSGASRVEIGVRVRRSAIDVHVRDDGRGFDVHPALVRAAQRGRLGIVGIGERVRMLGGTFEIDSAPGGPTTLRFTLPRTLS